MIRGLAVVLVLAALAQSAAGDEKKRAIVVPTELGGLFTNRTQWRREFNVALEDRLKVVRFSVLRTETLTPVEAECREAECLAAIASSHGADVAIAARIVNDQQLLTSYHLRVRIAERQADGTTKTRERERTCANCSEGQARDMLVTLLSATLANEPEPVEQPPVEPKKNPPVTSNATEPHHQLEPYKLPPVDPRQAEQERRRRWIFRGTGIGVGALGLLGVYQGFAELSHDGDHVVRNGITYRESTSKSQALFFSLGWGGVVAGGILSAIGWWPKKKDGRAVTVVPEVSPTGARLQMDLTF
jgi:hypothetical protein